MLLDLFRAWEDKEGDLRVSFFGGEYYDLNILSTMHAEEGGDIVADVVRVIQTENPKIRWDTRHELRFVRGSESGVG